ncbi:MAG: DUF4127 family protein [Treponema sp.]|jgi:hypothetical protein|nr:DUF4127 family protein [Treponema sp.]
MKISLLPLDSRPCNTLFPKKLAALAGLSLNMPDPGFLDYFTRPAHGPYVAQWLIEEAAKTDYFIISLDMLVYGGLIASRQGGAFAEVPSAEDSIKKLEILGKLKDINPGLTIFAFNVIMRTSITTLDEKSKSYWELITEYCRLKGRNDPGLSAVESQIPPDILGSFLAVRDRNHQVNLKAVKLLNENILDCLLLLQEDTSSGGIQQAEQKKLAEQIAPAAADRFFIHNGADEAGMLLLGRILNSINKPSIHWDFLYPPGQDMIAAYEDRPFKKNIESQVEACGLFPAPGDGAALRMLILPPKSGCQYDSFIQNKKPEDYDDDELDTMVQMIHDYTGGGKITGLLDTAYANGGHLRFMQNLKHNGGLKKLAAYAAWNTAANSLGTVLGQLSCYYHGMEQGDKSRTRELNERFTLERYLDDCLYQSLVRPKIDRHLAKRGINIFNLGTEKGRIEKRIYQELKSCAGDTKFTFTLPWPRTFEAIIEISGGGGMK